MPPGHRAGPDSAETGTLLYAVMVTTNKRAAHITGLENALLQILFGFLTVAVFVVIRDPNSQMAFWFSIIPFTSPIVMMARIPYDIPLWEIVLSLVLLYGSFVGMVWVASKIYRVGIFMYGKKPSLKELFKWIRYKY